MVLEVVLHVYDLSPSNRYTSWMGLGAFHTGVTIGQREYTFSPSGIVACVPQHPEQVLGRGGGYISFRESIVLGEINDMSVCNGVVASLRASFAPESYHVVRHNCNHFTDALALTLFNKHIPKWVNRAPRFGSALLSKPSKPTSGDGVKKLSKREQEMKREKSEEERNARPQVSAKQKGALAQFRAKSTAAAAKEPVVVVRNNNQETGDEAESTVAT